MGQTNTSQNNTSHISESLSRRDETSYNDSSVGININDASQSQLESLPRIGPVTAQKIISGRPYQTLDELVTKKVMSKSLFEKLKEQLTL